jgi:predicted transcriptional regulator
MVVELAVKSHYTCPMRETSDFHPILRREAQEIVAPDEQTAFSEAVLRGRAQAAAGEVVSGEAVFKWLASWGTDCELPPPLPGKRQ